MGSERVAVVDLGTNSTRLLVADVMDGTVRELDRRTTVTRLGEGVDASGRLSNAAIRRVYDTVSDYRAAIDDLGAARTVAVATSAVRDAENGDEFRRTLHERFGIEARTIPGEEEALLTFLGATSERAADGDPTLVIDIGGGSTEYVIGEPGEEPAFHTSTQAGSVRQTERHLHCDPPEPKELSELSEEVSEIIAASVPEELRHRVSDGIAVAGTATSLAAIEQQLIPYDPTRVHGSRLERPACEEMLAMLAEKTIEERRSVTGLHPDRAPTIVAGAAILVESMRAFGLEAFEVSERDILHGSALQAASA